ncbi:MAG TPA: hypothetical protein VII06_30595 [Chloroflexota bacterium]|jgi:hypothetical protein
MFPHPLDRYCLVSRLVAAARASYPARVRAKDPTRRGAEANTQKAVADRTRGVAFQKHVSDLEQLEVSLEKRDRWVTRTRLAAILHWGLELERDQIDAILWLHDGQPLSDEEVRYYRLAPPQQPPTPQALRERVIEQLREIVSHRYAPMGSQPATVRLFSADERGRSGGVDAAGELEAIPGQRLFVAAEPSRLTSPPGWLLGPRALEPTTASKELRQHELARTRVRHAQFLHALETYGERSIHSKTAIVRYVTGERVDPYGRSARLRREHIRHWIGLLRTYEHYEVGLVEETPSLELEIKSTVRAIMRGAPIAYQRHPTWGPSHLLFEDELSVLQFYLAFETAWDAIPAEDRTKADVIDWLDALLLL